MDLLILFGFIFVIGILFHNFLSIKKTKDKLEDVVRKLALEDNKSKK